MNFSSDFTNNITLFSIASDNLFSGHYNLITSN